MTDMLPQVPWGNADMLPVKVVNRTWGKCQLGKKESCINTNFCRAFAKDQNRSIRAPMTYKGKFMWSEMWNGSWCRFEAPLVPSYALKIDGYDKSGAMFTLPKKPPFGHVRFVEECPERPPEDVEVKRARKQRHLDKVASGKCTPRAKFRELQYPFVA